jgi:branched-chain amino acid transport system permease protein
MTLFLTALVAGLGVGAVYALIALSYTVIYSSTAIFNVAQGDLMMWGVLMGYYCLDVWHLPQAAAFPIVLLVVVALSLVEERIAIRPFVGRFGSTGIGWFIATLGFAFVLETVASNLYGAKPVAAIPGVFSTQSIYVGGLAIAPKFLLAFLVAVVVAVALEVFYKRTWLGNAMRGVAADQQVSALRGIDVRSISRYAFIIGGVVTGLGAFVVAPIVSANVTIGIEYSLKGFIAMAVGGFGSIKGSLVGGLLLGISEQLFDLYVNGNFEVVAGLILVLVVLIIRPAGIFGARRSRVV